MQPARVDSEPSQTDVAGSPDDRSSTRVPLERQVEMRFQDFAGFVTECSMNISATGMFIRCAEPQPAGSVLDFKFALADGERLIRGYGEVMWSRRRDDGPERPAGMGIRFLQLDAESRELIRWTVTRRYITGAGPCDVDEVRSAMRRAAELETARQERALADIPDPAAGVAPRPPARPSSAPRFREAGYAAAASAPPAFRPLRLAAASFALILGGLYLLPAANRSGGATGTTTDDVAAEEPAAATPEPGVSAPAPAQAMTAAMAAAGEVSDTGGRPPSPAVAGSTTFGVEPTPEDVVQSWALAWSEQRVPDYLAFYATDFRPPGDLSREAWHELRRARILGPREIQVEVAALTTVLEGQEQARVTFRQLYRSDSYRDAVRKTLVLVKEDDRWRILEERAEG